MRHQKVTVIAFRKGIPAGKTPLYIANTVTKKRVHNKSIVLIWPQNQQGCNNNSVLVVWLKNSLKCCVKYSLVPVHDVTIPCNTSVHARTSLRAVCPKEDWSRASQRPGSRDILYCITVFKVEIWKLPPNRHFWSQKAPSHVSTTRESEAWDGLGDLSANQWPAIRGTSVRYEARIWPQTVITSLCTVAGVYSHLSYIQSPEC